ncbi:MAG: ComEC/Rec2 family competence protein [Phycisphaeraceae bacterium]
MASRDGSEPGGGPGRPLVILALLWMLGIALGRTWPTGAVWLGIAGAALTGAAVCHLRGRWRGALHFGLAGVVALGAGWYVVRAERLSEHDVSRWATAEPQLASITGRVVGEPRLLAGETGPFAEFSYRTPGTSFVLEAASIVRGGEASPAAGRVQVYLAEADASLRRGRTIRATGWLSGLEGPANPGEPDYREILTRQGVGAKLYLETRANWQLVAPLRADSAGGAVELARRTVHEALLGGLRERMDAGTRELALLEAVLLGRWSVPLEAVYEDFRVSGLAHLLSISGTHVGIFIILLGLVVQAVVARPSRATAVLLAVLGLYLLALPMRVPIMRAAIMASLLCIGYASGRRTTPMGLLALAAVVVLIAWPTDLFSPGFQLSFAVVAGLVRFTPALAQRLGPAALVEPERRGAWWQLRRRGAQLVAANVVACVIAMPLVAHHFGIISPRAVVWAVLAAVLAPVVLGAGYLKMLVGLIAPAASGLLAAPAEWLGWAMLKLAELGAAAPGAAVMLGRPVSVAWTLAAIGAGAAVLGGRFQQRRIAGAACIGLVAGWAVLAQRPAPWSGSAGEPAARGVMFSVGGGSCHLVQLPGHTLMFDCGSRGNYEVGREQVVPALRALGVRRIDTLVISHADIDHFAGVPAVVERMSVGRVLTTPQLLREAEAQPRAAATLVGALREAGVEIASVTRGWEETLGAGRLEVLWPEPDTPGEPGNEASIVLRITAGDARLLYCGDAGETLTRALLDRGDDLRADVAPLPHHGGFHRASLDWLEAVRPGVVLESRGRRRGRDRWAPLLAERDVVRLVSEELGMVELTVHKAGGVSWRGFRGGEGELP